MTRAGAIHGTPVPAVAAPRTKHQSWAIRVPSAVATAATVGMGRGVSCTTTASSWTGMISLDDMMEPALPSRPAWQEKKGRMHVGGPRQETRPWLIWVYCACTSQWAGTPADGEWPIPYIGHSRDTACSLAQRRLCRGLDRGGYLPGCWCVAAHTCPQPESLAHTTPQKNLDIVL